MITGLQRLGTHRTHLDQQTPMLAEAARVFYSGLQSLMVITVNCALR
jgi:hypothetical protein